MSNFIKVGDKVINLDQITDVILENGYEPGQLRIISVNGGSDFKGEEAAALRHFFTGEANDVSQSYRYHLDRMERERKQAEWNKNFNIFCQENEVSDQDGFKDYYRYYLDESGENPTVENLIEYTERFKTRANSEIYF